VDEPEALGYLLCLGCRHGLLQEHLLIVAGSHDGLVLGGAVGLLLLVLVLIVGEVGDAGVHFPRLERATIRRCPPRVVLPGKEVTLEIFVLVLALEAHSFWEVGNVAAYLRR
jgi:hypothetical protein